MLREEVDLLRSGSTFDLDSIWIWTNGINVFKQIFLKRNFNFQL